MLSHSRFLSPLISSSLLPLGNAHASTALLSLNRSLRARAAGEFIEPTAFGPRGFWLAPLADYRRNLW